MIEIGPNLMEAIKVVAVAIACGFGAWAFFGNIKHW